LTRPAGPLARCAQSCSTQWPLAHTRKIRGQSWLGHGSQLVNGCRAATAASDDRFAGTQSPRVHGQHSTGTDTQSASAAHCVSAAAPGAGAVETATHRRPTHAARFSRGGHSAGAQRTSTPRQRSFNAATPALESG